jgi:membrane-bound lytic murein transglycosylase B
LVNAVSGAGARGVWQFMPETAKERGMEVNDIVDERYDLENQHKEPVAICYVPKEKFGI